MHDCPHENGLEYAGYALCFDCGAERRRQGAPDVAPSIREQRLERVGVVARGPRPERGKPDGVLCPVCEEPVSSLHALTAHAHVRHPVVAAVGV